MPGVRGSAAGRLDSLVGDGVEAAVKAKHRLRLRRLGWQRALEPHGDLWAAGDPAPREGCELDVLIDGAEALPAMADAMQQAQRSIHITGWHMAPDFELVRGHPAVVLGVLLAELAELVDVRILVWAGAPVPAFHPTRAEVRDASTPSPARPASAARPTRANTPSTATTRRRP
jgi:phosphatidylserine/phosphatidylglycerophosphate/cardiolipin synthase-like enzyme